MIKDTDGIGPGKNVEGTEMRYRDAFNQALRDELNNDKNVLIIGEDISGGFDKKTSRKNNKTIKQWDT